MRPTALSSAFALLLVLCWAIAARAEEGGCPAPPDHDAALERLFAQVQAAPSAEAARPIVNRMWELWADAPDRAAQELLTEGMQRRAASDYAGAVKAFDQLVLYCPDYAEGYNQRAFVNFIRRDYPAALRDLDEALARNPRHVGALSGRGLTLMALGRPAEARETLLAALALNPWLPERRFLPALTPEEGAGDAADEL